MSNVEIEVRGLEETQAKMEQVVRDLQGGEFEQGMRDATLILTYAAKKNLKPYQSPTVGGVDRGRLQSSITPEVRSHGDTMQGVVGSNVEYAPFQELGSRPHWPPLAALEVWARRHGTTAYVVARAIARRGNIPRKFLARALEDNAEKIFSLLGRVVAKIVSK